MSDEYKAILQNADEIKKAFGQQPRKLAYIWGIIADLYVDTAKIKGFYNVKDRMPVLKSILNNYSLPDLQAFFKAVINA